MTEETEDMLDDSFDDNPIDEVYEGEEVVPDEPEEKNDSSDDSFEEGDSLVGEQYKDPTKDEKFIDVHKGTLLDKKDVPALLQIKSFYEQNNIKIGEPKSGCRHCYGRGYTGFDIKAQIWIPCQCLFPAQTRMQKEQEHRRMMQEGRLVNTPEYKKHIRNMNKKAVEKMIHQKSLELFKKNSKEQEPK